MGNFRKATRLQARQINDETDRLLQREIYLAEQVLLETAVVALLASGGINEHDDRPAVLTNKGLIRTSSAAPGLH
jgi:hypothetical protein